MQQFPARIQADVRRHRAKWCWWSPYYLSTGIDVLKNAFRSGRSGSTIRARRNDRPVFR
jgi:hypothetical protein